MQRWPGSNLSVYIDDMTTQMFGRTTFVRHAMVRSMKDLGEAIRRANLQVAEDKGQVAANKFDFAEMLMKEMGKRGCPKVVALRP